MDYPRLESPSPDASTTMGSISPPDIDPETLEVGQPSLKDAAQAWSVFENLKQAQHTRNQINARIVEEYNGRSPYLESDVQPWQSNFNPLVLTGLVDKIVPVLVGYVENLKWLTQSKLKDRSDMGMRKTNELRELVTSTIRQWSGWRPFLSSLCQELLIVGYTYAARTDEYDWRPRHWRQDKAFVPEQTPQSAEHAQVFCAEQDFLIHELTDIIRKREIADAAKWVVENVVDSLNHALPKQQTGGEEPENQRKWVDIVQEGNLGASYASGAMCVEAAHVMVIETKTKKVTHVIIDRNREHHELLWHESRFGSMREVLTLFTLDPGNGNFFGSRGAGRRAVNYSVAIAYTLNDLIDLNRLASLLVLQADLSKGMPPPRVKRPFLWLTKDSTLVEQRKSASSDLSSGVLLINKLVELLQSATQQYIPNAQPAEQDQGNRTAREVTVDYQREQQSVSAFISRFAGQIAELIWQMQMAMFNKDTNDDAAMAARELALKGDEKLGIEPICTEDELQEFAKCVTAETLQDLTNAENAAKVQAANDPEIATSPFIDHKARMETKVHAMLPKAVADTWLKKDAVDPDEEAEQFGLQEMESAAMLGGAPGVPVSRRHNHKVHLDVLMPDIAKGIAGLEQVVSQYPQLVMEPEVGKQLDHYHTGMAHAEAHGQVWQKEQPPRDAQDLPKYLQAIEELGKRLEMLTQALIQAKTKMEAQMAKQGPQQPGGSGMVPQMPGAGGQPQPGAAPHQGPAPEQGEPMSPDGSMSESVLKSWITQFSNLDPNAQRRLQEVGGLLTPALAAADELERRQGFASMTQNPPPTEPPAPAEPIAPPSAPTPPREPAPPRQPAPSRPPTDPLMPKETPPPGPLGQPPA